MLSCFFVSMCWCNSSSSIIQHREAVHQLGLQEWIGYRGEGGTEICPAAREGVGIPLTWNSMVSEPCFSYYILNACFISCKQLCFSADVNKPSNKYTFHHPLNCLWIKSSHIYIFCNCWISWFLRKESQILLSHSENTASKPLQIIWFESVIWNADHTAKVTWFQWISYWPD